MMVDIERLTHEALDSMTIQDWEKCVRQAETIQSQDYEKEVHRDAILEPIILTILPGDSDSSDDEDTDNNEDKIARLRKRSSQGCHIRTYYTDHITR
jgi:hypothetical protein